MVIADYAAEEVTRIAVYRCTFFSCRGVVFDDAAFQSLAAVLNIYSCSCFGFAVGKSDIVYLALVVGRCREEHPAFAASAQNCAAGIEIAVLKSAFSTCKTTIDSSFV